jgi:hypothetical protein
MRFSLSRAFVAGSLGQAEARLVMDSVLQSWICRKCGRSNDVTVARAETAACEFCAQAAPRDHVASTEEAPRHQIVARLAKEYGEARKLASGTEYHVNLEWILGGQRDLERDALARDRDMAQLALLWLHDLARELDPEVSDSPASDLREGGSSAADRQAAAGSLRAAAREFAEAFLTELEPTPTS